MFDYYRPVSGMRCPVCGAVLNEWQGKDGPCGLFVWQEGIAAPIQQQVDEQAILPDSAREGVRLPERFVIYSYDCDCPFPVEAIGEVLKGTWNQTRIVTAEIAVRRREETNEQFKSRISWLEGKR